MEVRVRVRVRVRVGVRVGVRVRARVRVRVRVRVRARVRVRLANPSSDLWKSSVKASREAGSLGMSIRCGPLSIHLPGAESAWACTAGLVLS